MRCCAIIVLALACAVSIEARQLRWDPFVKVVTDAYTENEADADAVGSADADKNSATASHDTKAESKYDGYAEGKVVSVGKSGDGEADAASGGYSKTYGPAKATTWGGAYADEDLSYAATKAASASKYDGETSTYAKSKAEGEEGEATTESGTYTYGPALAYTDGKAYAKDDKAESKTVAASASADKGYSAAGTVAKTEGDAGETLSDSYTSTYGPAKAKADGDAKVDDGKASASSSASASSKDGGSAYASNKSAAKAKHDK